MKRSFIFVGFILFQVYPLYAQQTNPTPVPTPRPAPTPMFPSGGRASNIPSPGFEPLTKPLSVPEELALRQSLIQRFAQPFYRKPTDEELAAISPSPEVLKLYSAYVGREDRGIFRLVADKGCDVDPKIVNANEDCLKYSMPGSGNSFSFRTGTYRIRRLADLSYIGNGLFVPGLLTHGIIVSLGDVPLENVTLDSEGVDHLVEFSPTTDLASAKKLDESLIKGIQENGFRYGRATIASKNSTYALRSIAYRGKIIRSVHGALYNEMDFDRRRDVTIAFKVVECEDDGSLTIIWRRLRDSESPRLKLPDDLEPATKQNYSQTRLTTMVSKK
jgi:hypothetical protein